MAVESGEPPMNTGWTSRRWNTTRCAIRASRATISCRR